MIKSFVISCEYATCAIPEAYRELFQVAEERVASPEGWDSGALNLAQALATRLRTHLYHGNHTRLLIDLDRDGEERWSEISREIPGGSRQRLADREDGAYRQALQQKIAEDLRRHDQVFLLSIRTTDDSAGRVTLESFGAGGVGEGLAEAWRARLFVAGLDASHNRETTGSALAAELGSLFPPEKHGFVRLKVAQSYFLEGQPLKWEVVKKVLMDALVAAAEDVGEIAPPPAVEEIAVEEIVVEEPVVEEPVMEEPVMEEPAKEEPAKEVAPSESAVAGPARLMEPSGQGLLF